MSSPVFLATFQGKKKKERSFSGFLGFTDLQISGSRDFRDLRGFGFCMSVRGLLVDG